MRVAVPLALAALAALLRVWALGAIPTPFGDESYYTYDAAAYLGGGFGIEVPGAPELTIEGEGTWVHPPLGKWVIALLGVGPLGDGPLGWRLPSAAFGTLGVLLVYRLGLELWRSVGWAALAALLLALDGLHLVHSRTALLDVFVTTFVTAGVLFTAMHRTRAAGGRAVAEDRAAREPSRVDRLFGSRYRLAAGAVLGAAAATKWIGVAALALAAGLSLWWDLSGPHARPVGATLGRALAAFGLVPVAVYLASYTAFFVQHGPAAGAFLELQARMFEFHRGYRRALPEASGPLTWPLLLRPVRYHPAGGLAAQPGAAQVWALGNPLLWWGFLAAVPGLAIRILRRRGWQDGIVAGGYAVMLAPWVLAGRTQFIYYLLPAVPFMALNVAAALRALPPAVRARAGPLTAALAMLVAAAYLPAWLGLPVGGIRAAVLRAVLAPWAG